MRTPEERQKAIETLKLNKEKCHQFNFFGEDNHEKIDVMIEVISEEMSENELYKRYPSEDEEGNQDSELHSKFTSAINARDYLKGDLELKDLLYPEKPQFT